MHTDAFLNVAPEHFLQYQRRARGSSRPKPTHGEGTNTEALEQSELGAEQGGAELRHRPFGDSPAGGGLRGVRVQPPAPAGLARGDLRQADPSRASGPPPVRSLPTSRRRFKTRPGKALVTRRTRPGVTVRSGGDHAKQEGRYVQTNVSSVRISALSSPGGTGASPRALERCGKRFGTKETSRGRSETSLG